MSFDPDACTEAMRELTGETSVGDPQEELATAANFVLRYGALGSFLDEPELTRAQSWVGPPGAAFSLIGHWSVERNDPSDHPAYAFEVHTQSCQVCRFLEDICVTNGVFEEEEETCEMCGGGLDAHGVGIYHKMGTPALYCVGQWQPTEPAVFDAGAVEPSVQVGAAYAARWWAPLADGAFAVITRTYYVGYDRSRDAYALIREDDYITCRDPNHPDKTQIHADTYVRGLDSDDPTGEDVNQLAVDSFPPDPGEFDQNYTADMPLFAIPAPA
jgi:hypothetical protein